MKKFRKYLLLVVLYIIALVTAPISVWFAVTQNTLWLLLLLSVSVELYLTTRLSNSKNDSEESTDE